MRARSSDIHHVITHGLRMRIETLASYTSWQAAQKSLLQTFFARKGQKAMSLYKPLLLQLCMIAVFAILAGRLRAQSTEAPSSEACTTGPAMIQSNSIFVNGRQYLSDSGEVACDGHITVWHFCHYVIGFRHLEMELWAGAWRLEGDTFSLVGLNVITVEPPGFEEDQLRCMEYEVDPFEWIEAKQGDYIGFYLPDNGVFVASASPQSDPEHRQNQVNKLGYAETFNSSEVEVAASSSGRALLRAEISKL